MQVRSISFTHPGHQRKNNEDSFYSSDERGLWIVCDGMGGHQEGNFASHLVTDIFEQMQMRGSFDDKINDINAQIYNIHRILQKKAHKIGNNVVIGTTLVLLLIEGNRGACIHSGDSRCYIYRNGKLATVTQDHAKTVINQGEERKMLTRALSAPGELSIEIKRFSVQSDDIFLLCSDGFYDNLSSAKIKNNLVNGQIEQSLKKMSALVLDGVADDNLTASIIEVV